LRGKASHASRHAAPDVQASFLDHAAASLAAATLTGRGGGRVGES
jgi:hypothetical protein